MKSDKNIKHGSNLPHLLQKHSLMTGIIGNGNQRILISGKMLCVCPQKSRTIYGAVLNNNTEVEFCHDIKLCSLGLLLKFIKQYFIGFGPRRDVWHLFVLPQI